MYENNGREKNVIQRSSALYVNGENYAKECANVLLERFFRNFLCQACFSAYTYIAWLEGPSNDTGNECNVSCLGLCV